MSAKDATYSFATSATGRPTAASGITVGICSGEYATDEKNDDFPYRFAYRFAHRVHASVRHGDGY